MAILKNLIVNGDSVLLGNLNVNNTLSVNNDITIGGNTTINGELLVNDGITAGGNATIDGELTVNNDTNISGGLSVNDNITVGGNANITTGLTVGDVAQFDGDVTFNGNIIAGSTELNIGSSNNRFNNIYANNIDTNNINANTKINRGNLEISLGENITDSLIINIQGSLYIGTKYTQSPSLPSYPKCAIILTNGSASEDIQIIGNLVPNEDIGGNLGTDEIRWNQIYGEDIYALGIILASDKMEAINGFFQTSDIRKKNIEKEIDLSKAYELINKCQTVVYTLKDDESKKEQIGLIAQEVKEIFPEIVNEDTDGYLSIDYAKLSVILMQIAKEQLKQITSIENRLAKLEQKFN